jgi:ribosomal protein L13E
MGGFISRPKPAPRPEPRPEPKPIVKPMVETKDEAKYDDKKRRGRRSTILTSVTGATDELELAKKTLLGG